MFSLILSLINMYAGALQVLYKIGDHVLRIHLLLPAHGTLKKKEFHHRIIAQENSRVYREQNVLLSHNS